MAAGECQIKILGQQEFIKFHVRHYCVFSVLLAVLCYTEWRQQNTDMHCMNSDGVGQCNRIQLYNDAKFMLRFKLSEHKTIWSKKIVTQTPRIHPLRFLHSWTLALISGFLFITPIHKTELMFCLTNYFLMLLVTSENFWNITFFGKTLCSCHFFFFNIGNI